MASSKKKSASSSAILTLALELMGVGLFTLIAGVSPDMGTIMVIIMVGFWLIFMITQSSLVSSLEKTLIGA